ncbi:fimbria/pilus outer membrane usher protein [Pseudomonas sp. WS 5412]|uniref:fimbria/pilus outer membrane usher protein n=1 Tax=Pseudomonas sp. WS 5412 TaxID=2717487 RepID=UPI0015B3897B|nr:fimbria/pilus outer membrane usher protein [Pseudomonas sp. WS 5412]
MSAVHSPFTLAFILATLTGSLLSAAKIQAAETELSSNGIEFDPEPLRMRGLDPALAEFFRHAPRFMPGESNVELSVNGVKRGQVKVRFDASGDLCADQGFLKAAGLLVEAGKRDESSCFDLTDAWAQTEVLLHPAEQRVDLVVPAEAVDKSISSSTDWKHGGVAGMLNYDAQYLDSSGASAGVTFMQVSSEGGLNVDDWILRSRQTFSRFNGVDTLRHQAAYAQRSFTGTKQVFQAGQINLSNSMFSTGQVMGLQVFPEAALQSDLGGPALVEGVADSQSVVEVRQAGVLVYSTTVPAGPFKLSGLSLLNTRMDLEVTLTASNGEKRQFIVPASALLRRGHTVAPGLSFGLGKLEQEGSSLEPLVATVAKGWVLNPRNVLQAGVLKSSTYQAGGVALDSQIWDRSILSLQGIVAQDLTHDSKGGTVNAALSYRMSERLGFSINASQQSAGFRELSDSLQRDSVYAGLSRSSTQLGAGVDWSTQDFGNFSLSRSQSREADGYDTVYVRGSWSKQFGRVYLSASLEQDSGTSISPEDKRFYLTLNFPLGNDANVNSYFNHGTSNSRAGVRYSDRSGRDRGWSLSSDRDFHNDIVSNSGSLDMLTPISQLSGSLTQDSNNYTSWSARSSGSLVAHDGGLSFAPYRVGDTFGVARVGEEAGVKLETPSGPTWTDKNGYAVLPSLNGFRRSIVQVDTRSLSRNVDIGNAWYEAEPARGSVNYVEFDVLRTRRVLVDLQDSKGQPMQKGAAVFDRDGNFITVVGEKGRVFIPDASTALSFDVQDSSKKFCSFTLKLAEKADSDEIYETTSAHCR